MKVALLFSGQPRFITGPQYSVIKECLLDRYDCDVFCHYWWIRDQKNEYITSSWSGLGKYEIDANQPIDQILENLYQPKKTSYDAPLEQNTANVVEYNIRSMYTSMYKCYQLYEDYSSTHNIKYDWVIRSRPDYALNVIIPFNQLSNEHIYIPDCRMVPTRDFGNDQFAFSSQDNMDKYMTTWDHVDEYYESGVQFIGEDLMQANIRKHGLVGDKLVYVNMNNPFPPGPYNGTPHSLIRDDMELWKGL